MIYKDQLMREVRLDQPPSRIICLVPSITELLSDLGLDDRIAGITKFCIHPDHLFRNKPMVGGTKKVDHEKIKSLLPDLIIANKEENTKEDVELLSQSYPVWISNITSLDEAIDMILKLGAITGSESSAEKIVNTITGNFQKLRQAYNISTLYLIWKSPYMGTASGTFVDDMLNRCGLRNVLAQHERYPELSLEQIKELNPSLVLLSSEPFPFKEKHITELKSLLPESDVLLADGEYFSWYGSRLIGAPSYFNSLLENLPFNRQSANYGN